MSDRRETVKKLAGKALRRILISTDKDEHFYGAIVQNAIEEEDITGLLSNKITITRITIQAKENLAFDVMFFSKDSFADTDLDDDTFLGFEKLDIPTYGIRIAGANQYYLDVSGINFEYEDEDESKELHIALRCRTAAGKTAQVAGEVKLTFTYFITETQGGS